MPVRAACRGVRRGSCIEAERQRGLNSDWSAFLVHFFPLSWRDRPCACDASISFHPAGGGALRHFQQSIPAGLSTLQLPGRSENILTNYRLRSGTEGPARFRCRRRTQLPAQWGSRSLSLLTRSAQASGNLIGRKTAHPFAYL